METKHKPVLLDSVIELLNPEANQNFIDCTLGGGGHAEAILEKTGPNGKLLGFDWDSEAVRMSGERLIQYKKRTIFVNESYTKIKEVVYDKKFDKVSGVLVDLGLSSDQLQVSGRGFSFQLVEALDMRFNPDETELTASEIVNKWPKSRIKQMLFDNADEKFASRISEAIDMSRREKPIETTLELCEVVRKAVPAPRTRINPATKTFQALRMEVNSELENTRQILNDAIEVLEPGGRLAVITFHSIEDRIVKQYFKKESRECICPREIPECRCGHKIRLKLITKKPIKPTTEEITENPRTRSAKLRVVEKVSGEW
jgi:16S rRNA (cytosine1402-N4)-methyltransferase